MKKTLVVLLVMGIVIVAASTAMAKIANSKHDLTVGTAAVNITNTNLSACQFCHTPHLKASQASNLSAPLWNRTMSADGSFVAADGTAQYQVYGASASNGTGTTLSGSQVNAPGPNSKTCLSCHDGTLSLANVIVGNPASPSYAGTDIDGTGKLLSTAGAYIGTDLRLDHPVGVVYDYNKALAGLANTVDATGIVVSGKNWKIYGGGNGVGTVECGSCHDPHGDDSSVVGSLKAPFLKDTKSTICTDCHSNK